MRTIIILFFLGFTVTSFSQFNDKSESNAGNIKIEELPAVVIKNAGDDFSVYLPDRNAGSDVRNLEEKFIAYDLGKDYEGYENYLVMMQSEKGILYATYNSNGKLVSVVESYKNITPPSDLIYVIYKNYPGWEILNNKYLYTQKDGDILKKEYNFKIRKDNEIKKLLINSKGEIIAQN